MRQIIRKALISTMLACGLFVSSSVMVAQAGDFTVVTKIKWLRSYLNGAYFVGVDSSRVIGRPACTTVYKVNAIQPGAKTIIATLLSAKAMNANVSIELDNAGCKGWGTLITSVVLM